MIRRYVTNEFICNIVGIICYQCISVSCRDPFGTTWNPCVFDPLRHILRHIDTQSGLLLRLSLEPHDPIRKTIYLTKTIEASLKTTIILLNAGIVLSHTILIVLHQLNYKQIYITHCTILNINRTLYIYYVMSGRN